MNPLREVLSLHAGTSSVQRLWMCAAAIVAMCLLSFYVSLLNEQVARGEQMRQALRGTSNQAVTRVVALPTSLAVAQRPAQRSGASTDRSSFQIP